MILKKVLKNYPKSLLKKLIRISNKFLNKKIYFLKYFNEPTLIFSIINLVSFNEWE